MLGADKELVWRRFEELWNQQNLAVAEELMAEEYLEHAVAPFGQAEPWAGQRAGCHAPDCRVVAGPVPHGA